jgi:hypothetical protein
VLLAANGSGAATAAALLKPALRADGAQANERGGVAGGVRENVGTNGVGFEAGKFGDDNDAAGGNHTPRVEGLARHAQSLNDHGIEPTRAQRGHDRFGFHRRRLWQETIAAIQNLNGDAVKTRSQRISIASRNCSCASDRRRHLPRETIHCVLPQAQPST